jgi:hypothetical protein
MDILRVRALKSQGHHCAGAYRFKNCQYNGYNNKIPRGTVMLEIIGTYRFCPSCSEQILPELEKELSACRKIIMKEDIKEEVKEAVEGISLLRGYGE